MLRHRSILSVLEDNAPNIELDVGVIAAGQFYCCSDLSGEFVNLSGAVQRFEPIGNKKTSSLRLFDLDVKVREDIVEQTPIIALPVDLDMPSRHR
jgi:hypothetical protein